MKYFLRVLIVLGCGTLVLIAEDFWKKPFTEWTPKEAARLMENSPWAHQVTLDFGSMEAMSGGARQRGGGSMGESEGGGFGGGGGGGRGGRGGGGNDADGSGASRTRSLNFFVRWQSALPLRQAMVVVRYGREKAESEEAKKFLSQTVTEYVVGVIGVQGRWGSMSQERFSEAAKTTTTLLIKDKQAIAAQGGRIESSQRPNVADLYFFFPKTNEITLEDKEVEFVAKLGPLEVKRKFKLKDMMVGNKLEL